MNNKLKENLFASAMKLDLFVESFLLLSVFFLPISKAVIEIGTIGAILCWLVGKIIRREDFRMTPLIVVPYLSLLALCLASIFYANPLVPEYRSFLKWFQYMGIVAVASEQLQDPKKISRLCFVFLISMTLVSINGFYQLIFGTDFLRHVSLDPGRITRMKSSLGAANSLASFYLFALPLSLFYTLKAFKVNKASFAFFVALSFLFLSAFIATFSRSAFLGLVISTSLYLALRNRKVLFAFLLGLLIVMSFSKPLRDNFVTSLNFSDTTIHERVQQWKVGFELGLERPLIGHGVNTFYKKMPAIELPSGSYRGYAHNSYLQLFVELGLVGLVLFFIPLMAGLCSFLKSKEDTFGQFVFIGVSAYALQALFDNNFYAMQPAFLFWIFWGMFLGKRFQKFKCCSA